MHAPIFLFANQACIQALDSPKPARVDVFNEWGFQFRNVYAALTGPIAGMKNDPNLQTPTPTIDPNIPLSSDQLNELIHIEQQALQFIRTQVENPELKIGGIFIEPVSIYQGLKVYRPEFMLQLRALADELEVPIFADEIMAAVRTGTFRPAVRSVFLRKAEGFGRLMLHVETKLQNHGRTTVDRRMLPHLTITRQQIDSMFPKV